MIAAAQRILRPLPLGNIAHIEQFSGAFFARITPLRDSQFIEAARLTFIQNEPSVGISHFRVILS